jgi:uncharacterized membrane protein YheB (UPF0754 family)
MNKTLLTNVLSSLLILSSFFIPSYQGVVLSTGLFAFSGGVTNWLAIHMLFERVPFLYGSGVIPTRFEEFKSGIKTLIVNEFFTKENIQRFFDESNTNSLENLAGSINFERVFLGLVEAIETSSMGGMLKMMGGKQALEPLREPIIDKLKIIISEMKGDHDLADIAVDEVTEKIEAIIDRRLEELTPETVKKIIETMIRKHLGWLVVWGGVFGGLIGFLVSVCNWV